MKTAFKITCILFAIGVTGLYILFSFYWVTFDFRAWSPDGRLGFCVMTVMGSIFSLAPILHKIQD